MKSLKSNKLFLLLLFLTHCSSIRKDTKNEDLFLPLKDKIEVIYPASYRKSDEAKELLKKFHQKVPMWDKKVPFHIKSDESRFSDLKEALYGNKPILWAYQGGYGSPRLLKYFDKEAPYKIIVGYSDITALHLFASQKWGWKTLHAPIFLELLSDQKDRHNFKILSQILKGTISKWEIPSLIPCNQAAKKSAEIKGLLTGGNLTILVRSLQTSWKIDGKNKIIFIEDIGEKGYRIDRNLDHLKEAGVFDHAKAIILGDFFEKQEDEHVDFALKRFASQLKIPVFQSDKFGHGKNNIPLLYNGEALIKGRDLIIVNPYLCINK